MLDVSSLSRCWITMMGMLVSREGFGVGMLDNCLYAASHTNTLHIFYVINIIYVIIINKLMDVREQIV